mgnify:CR=1 FL=1
MEIVKKLKDHIIYKKRSGRYGVKNSRGQWINGEEKTKLLVSEGLVKVSEAKKVEEPVAEETTPADGEAGENSAEA